MQNPGSLLGPIQTSFLPPPVDGSAVSAEEVGRAKEEQSPPLWSWRPFQRGTDGQGGPKNPGVNNLEQGGKVWAREQEVLSRSRSPLRGK